MVILNKEQFNELDKMGLIVHHGMGKNYVVLNRGKKSCRRKYAVVYDWRQKALHDSIKNMVNGK